MRIGTATGLRNPVFESSNLSRGTCGYDEMVDVPGLKLGDLGRPGSSPGTRTHGEWRT